MGRGRHSYSHSIIVGQNGHNPNVRLVVPRPAQAAAPFAPNRVPTPEEVIQLQAAQIRELEQQVRDKTVAASTIANAAINLLDRLCDLGYGTRDSGIGIDKDTWEKTRGLQLTVAGDEKTGRVVVRAREQEKPAPLAFEDRQD